MAKAQSKEQAVIVTTEYRGVFFGYTADVSGNVITLSRARNCLYWSADVRGFMGLAQTGTDGGMSHRPASGTDHLAQGNGGSHADGGCNRRMGSWAVGTVDDGDGDGSGYGYGYGYWDGYGYGDGTGYGNGTGYGT